MKSLASLIVSLAVLGGASADEGPWKPANPPARFVRIPQIPEITLARAQPIPVCTEDACSCNFPEPGIIAASFQAQAPTRLVRAKVEQPISPPSLIETENEPPAVPVTRPGDTPPATQQPVVQQPTVPQPAPQPLHPWPAVLFPYPSTHWTRTTLPPGAGDFSAVAMSEDPADLGPPPFEPCRFYGAVEYLLWWTRPANLPPLVTTGPAASQGILGQPGTVVLFGGSAENFGQQSGARFTAGYWLDCEQTVALEGNLFFLGQQTVSSNASSNVFPVLARPFFEINPPSPGEFRQLTAFPGLFSGTVHASADTRLWGAELNARCKGCCGCFLDSAYRIDWLAGVRYLELNDHVQVNEAIQFSPGVLPNLPLGGTGVVFDSFGTRNQFMGGQVGTEIEFRHGCWSLDLKGKIAVGDTHETVNINGGQLLVSNAGGSATFQGGLLALPSNIGRHTRDEFGVVPELGVQLGYYFTEHFRVFVGYSFLYWSNVLRAGDQIDRVIDVTQIPNFNAPGVIPAGQTRPAVLFRDTGFWAQGLNVGLEWHF
jgi:hypothetical protein